MVPRVFCALGCCPFALNGTYAAGKRSLSRFMIRYSANRLPRLTHLAALISMCVIGCARPQTFADPADQMYQPPVVSPGVQSPTPADPFLQPQQNGYTPPGQSYTYGGQPTAADDELSEAEMQALYEKYYGPSANITPNTNPPAANPPTIYPGGSSQSTGQDNSRSGNQQNGAGVITQRPIDTRPQNPINDTANQNLTGAQSAGSGGAVSPNASGQARPMVPINRGTSGGSNSHPMQNNADAQAGTSLPNAAQPDPRGVSPGQAGRSTDLSVPVIKDSQANAALPGGNVGTNAGNSGRAWPYTLVPGNNFARQNAPLNNSVGDSSSASNSSSGGGSSQMAFPNAGNSQGSGEANGTTPGSQPLRTSPVSAHSEGSTFPPGAQWPQKPIPLKRESS